LSNKTIVNIRRNVENYDDPYIDEQSLRENSVCKKCHAVYTSGRWYIEGSAPHYKTVGHAEHVALCPACQKLRDRVPGGVLRLMGEFVINHRDEILNLIRNESEKAMAVNPLERIMSLETEKNAIEIQTTNEKLAQRIGKAIHKAYSGHIEYKWSEDTKHARVNWHREA
jgi:NMD protein affecting ribosome stability and mRNA decay